MLLVHATWGIKVVRTTLMARAGEFRATGRASKDSGILSMNRDLFILPTEKLPVWLTYPGAFLRLVDQGLVDITPWHILKSAEVVQKCKGLASRYPSRALFPFAYRQDNDDVACWSSGAGERVFVIHDFASPGWENEAEFVDVWSWFRSALEESIHWQ